MNLDTGTQDDRDQAAGELSPVRLIVFTPWGVEDEYARQLRQLLTEAGFADVTLVGYDELIALGASVDFGAGRLLLISLMVGEARVAWHGELDRVCSEHGIPWMHASLHPERGYADIGPVFRPIVGPIFGPASGSCFQCFSSLHAVPAEPREEDVEGPGPIAVATWLAMVTLRLSAFVNRQTGGGDQEFFRYRLPDWQSTKLFAGFLPGCVRCDPECADVPAKSIHGALLFEQYLAARRPAHLDAEAQRRFEALCDALSRQSKVLPNSQHVPLERGTFSLPSSVASLLRKAPPQQNPPLSVEHLGHVLKITAGIRQVGAGRVKTRRWAATAGNLGSVELFLLVRNVVGLADGVYFYQARNHSLAKLEPRRGAHNLEEVIAYLSPSSPHADVVVVYTAAFARLQRKYGPIGYKLATLDAGVALSQLHLGARHFGLWCETQEIWPEAYLERLCHLSEGAEFVTAVAALSRRSLSPMAMLDADDSLHVRATPLPAVSGLTVDQLFAKLFRESRMDDEDFGRRRMGMTAADAPLHAAQVRALAPPDRAKNRSLGAVLTKRRSATRFSAGAIDMEQLSAMLYDATAMDLSPQAEPLDVLIASKRVAHLPPAVYRFDTAKHVLSHAGPAPSGADEVTMFAGQDYTSAAVLIWIGGNLQAACDREGGFGYRKLLLRAGAAANRLHLSSVALGLEGRIIAGIAPGAYAGPFRFNTSGRTMLVGFVAGHPEDGFGAER